MPIVETVAALLEPTPAIEPQPLVVKTNFLDLLNKAISSVVDLNQVDPSLKLDKTLKTLYDRLAEVQQSSGRLFLLEEAEPPQTP